MPRHPRILSKTGTYHIMLRGNEKKKIFIDDQDKGRIIEILYNKKSNQKFSLYSYCIMDNHIHLVMREGKDEISKSMQRISVSYARYFNNKYERVGHVFQDRYKSENIEDERYLLAAIRYVHQNPLKAGISSMDAYKWSSYKVYVDGYNEFGSLPEIDEVLGIFSNSKQKSIELFEEFSAQNDNTGFADLKEDEKKYAGTEGIARYLKEYLAEKGLKPEIISQSEYRHIRDELIRGIARDVHVSLRKVAETLGVNREVVRKVVNKRTSS